MLAGVWYGLPRYLRDGGRWTPIGRVVTVAFAALAVLLVVALVPWFVGLVYELGGPN